MDPITTTMLLASIDHTLASLRAALIAADDPEQTEEAQTGLAVKAAADLARLVVSSRDPGWKGMPEEVSGALERAGRAGEQGDLEEAEAELTRGRESLGGPSR